MLDDELLSIDRKTRLQLFRGRRGRLEVVTDDESGQLVIKSSIPIVNRKRTYNKRRQTVSDVSPVETDSHVADSEILSQSPVVVATSSRRRG